MNFVIPDFTPAIPEIFVLVMACITLLVALFSKERSRFWSYTLVQITIIIAAVLSLTNLPDSPIYTFDQSFIHDKISVLLKLFIYFTTFITLLYSRHYVVERHMAFPEYYVLALLSMLGMMVVTSAYSFLILFLGIELFSLPTYAMIALKRESGICAEAAIKYFIISAIATGMLLYGMSMLYGASGSIQLNEIANTIVNIPKSSQLILSFGLVFLLVGIAFKFGAVPFHMWVPDVYTGAPTSVTLFIGTAPKIAALAVAYRILEQALPSLQIQWQPILIIISVLSMAVGNMAAIVQSNIKRMLAYSSIAHIGYMLLGLIAGTKHGYAAAAFYIITYSIMSLGGFGMLVLLSRKKIEIENIDDLQGLNSRNPWLALMMLLVMFSMAGIPPLVGFMAKLGVLESIINVGLIWLAVVALIFAIIGAYYYIRVVKVMYFERPVVTTPMLASRDMRVAITVNGLLLLLMGIFPGILFRWCQVAF